MKPGDCEWTQGGSDPILGACVSVAVLFASKVCCLGQEKHCALAGYHPLSCAGRLFLDTAPDRFLFSYRAQVQLPRPNVKQLFAMQPCDESSQCVSG